MSKIVFVLGAGASAHCGTPLMNNFLEVAEDLWRRGEVEEASEHFKELFDAIGNLQGIHSKAKLDTYNIETIYAAFEMGKLLDSLPGVEENSQIEELISSIKKVIAYTLERTTKLPCDGGNVNAPKAYFEFAGRAVKMYTLLLPNFLLRAIALSNIGPLAPCITLLNSLKSNSAP